MSVFIFPCSNSSAYSHYIDTVRSEKSIDDISSVIDRNIEDEIRDNVGETFRIWGVVPGTAPKEANRNTYNTLQIGDVVVFYRKKKIIAKAKVKYKMENANVSEKIWGRDNNGETWKLLIFLEDYNQEDIDSTKPDGSLLMYQSFSRAGGDNENRILELLNMPQQTSTMVSVSVSTSTETTLSNIIDEAFRNNKQIVLTGAPGTGKTYGVREYVKINTLSNKERYRFVQFHPSFDYSDFVEGLRPVLIRGTSNNPTFVRIDGIFKSFCRTIVLNNYKDETGIDPSSIDYNLFKANYSLFEKEGKFQTRYYFIIDEINRADLSKVFGELMFGLEETYRGINNPIKTQYKNLMTYHIDSDGRGIPLAFDCFKDGFFVPTNLYIIGTMNDIDKSVEAFDFALRRRFEWIEIEAKDVAKSALKEMFPNSTEQQIDELVNKINNLNETISEVGKDFGLTDSYHIGHAYFKNIDMDDPSSLEKIFNRNIVSILREYTRGREYSDVKEFLLQCANALGVEFYE